MTHIALVLVGEPHCHCGSPTFRQVERWTPTTYGRQATYVGDDEIAEEVHKLAPTLRGNTMKNKGKR